MSKKEKEVTAVNDVILIAEEQGFEIREELEELHEILVDDSKNNQDQGTVPVSILSTLITLAELYKKLTEINKHDLADIVGEFITQTQQATGVSAGITTLIEVMYVIRAKENIEEAKPSTSNKRTKELDDDLENVKECFGAMVAAINKRGRVF